MEHVIAPEDSTSLSPLYRAPRVEDPWSSRHLWYQTKPHEVHNTDVALGLISECARLGVHVITLPAVLAEHDPDYIERATEKAARRSMYVLPYVGEDVFDHVPNISESDRYAVLEEWFDYGALGLEVGTIDLDEPIGVNDAGSHVHAGWDARELLAFVEGTNPDAIVSATLRSSSIQNVAAHALEHYFDLVRFEVTTSRALDAHNFAHETATYLRFFEIAGMLPAWNCTFSALDNLAGELSEGALLLTACFYPGSLHFEQNIPGRSPSLRHALRMREALGLHRTSILLNAEMANDGFLWLINDKLEMLLNFGPHSYGVPADGRVVMSSLIELPADGAQLLVPPGEAVWLRR